ncbi:hypothetical protein [Pseudoalteromonas aurantia]|uniref:Uncharacterized protein n=1 Tax=Pseudoalteromonas aurantia 208 TaxID=1314867 RepID=A0ABR9ED58_9GAMM|nr:hypothetical protein [Pseudoalteromonas aurantia]MBE0368180.1 hypothetical protein [Pseudoalteromonas aurantia 208]
MNLLTQGTSDIHGINSASPIYSTDHDVAYFHQQGVSLAYVSINNIVEKDGKYDGLTLDPWYIPIDHYSYILCTPDCLTVDNDVFSIQVVINDPTRGQTTTKYTGKFSTDLFADAQSLYLFIRDHLFNILSASQIACADGQQQNSAYLVPIYTGNSAQLLYLEYSTNGDNETLNSCEVFTAADIGLVLKDPNANIDTADGTLTISTANKTQFKVKYSDSFLATKAAAQMALCDCMMAALGGSTLLSESSNSIAFGMVMQTLTELEFASSLLFVNYSISKINGYAIIGKATSVPASQLRAIKKNDVTVSVNEQSFSIGKSDTTKQPYSPDLYPSVDNVSDIVIALVSQALRYAPSETIVIDNRSKLSLTLTAHTYTSESGIPSVTINSQSKRVVPYNLFEAGTITVIDSDVSKTNAAVPVKYLYPVVGGLYRNAETITIDDNLIKTVVAAAKQVNYTWPIHKNSTFYKGYLKLAAKSEALLTAFNTMKENNPKKPKYQLDLVLASKNALTNDFLVNTSKLSYNWQAFEIAQQNFLLPTHLASDYVYKILDSAKFSANKSLKENIEDAYICDLKVDKAAGNDKYDLDGFKGKVSYSVNQSNEYAFDMTQTALVFTDSSLKLLKANVSDAIYNKLQGLVGNVYFEKSEFFDAITNTLGSTLIPTETADKTKLFNQLWAAAFHNYWPYPTGFDLSTDADFVKFSINSYLEIPYKDPQGGLLGGTLNLPAFYGKIVEADTDQPINVIGLISLNPEKKPHPLPRREPKKRKRTYRSPKPRNPRRGRPYGGGNPPPTLTTQPWELTIAGVVASALGLGTFAEYWASVAEQRQPAISQGPGFLTKGDTDIDDLNELNNAQIDSANYQRTALVARALASTVLGDQLLQFRSIIAKVEQLPGQLEAAGVRLTPEILQSVRSFSETAANINSNFLMNATVFSPLTGLVIDAIPEFNQLTANLTSTLASIASFAAAEELTNISTELATTSEELEEIVVQFAELA